MKGEVERGEESCVRTLPDFHLTVREAGYWDRQNVEFGERRSEVFKTVICVLCYTRGKRKLSSSITRTLFSKQPGDTGFD